MCTSLYLLRRLSFPLRTRLATASALACFLHLAFLYIRFAVVTIRVGHRKCPLLHHRRGPLRSPEGMHTSLIRISVFWTCRSTDWAVPAFFFLHWHLEVIKNSTIAKIYHDFLCAWRASSMYKSCWALVKQTTCIQSCRRAPVPTCSDIIFTFFLLALSELWVRSYISGLSIVWFLAFFFVWYSTQELERLRTEYQDAIRHYKVRPYGFDVGFIMSYRSASQL